MTPNIPLTDAQKRRGNKILGSGLLICLPLIGMIGWMVSRPSAEATCYERGAPRPCSATEKADLAQLLATGRIGPGATNAPTSDLYARVACRNFGKIAKKVSTGEVNFEELRPLLKDLYASGKFADKTTAPNIEPSLRQMLLGVTYNDAKVFGAGVDRFMAACALPSAQ